MAASQSDAESMPLLGSKSEDFSSFSDVNVRHGFVMKVYAILCVQLVATVLIGGVVMVHFESLAKTNPGLVMTLMFASLIISISCWCVFMCCQQTMRTVPTNYIILSLFTMAESVMIGIACTQYTVSSVLVVLGITALIVFGLSLFACQTSIDFTGFGPYLFCALLCLCGVSFCFMIASMLGLGNTDAFKTLHLIFAGVGAFIFACFLVYDTQKIIGGNHSEKFSIDDYCMAAINLYMDIIQLFLFLLELFGQRR